MSVLLWVVGTSCRRALLSTARTCLLELCDQPTLPTHISISLVCQADSRLQQWTSSTAVVAHVVTNTEMQRNIASAIMRGTLLTKPLHCSTGVSQRWRLVATCNSKLGFPQTIRSTLSAPANSYLDTAKLVYVLDVDITSNNEVWSLSANYVYSDVHVLQEISSTVGTAPGTTAIDCTDDDLRSLLFLSGEPDITGK